jgi:hypothetical protein
MTHVLALVLVFFIGICKSATVAWRYGQRGLAKMEILMSRYPVFQNPWGVFLVGVVELHSLQLTLLGADGSGFECERLEWRFDHAELFLGWCIFMALGSQMLIHLNTPKTEPFAPNAAQTSSLVNRWKRRTSKKPSQHLASKNT